MDTDLQSRLQDQSNRPSRYDLLLSLHPTMSEAMWAAGQI